MADIPICWWLVAYLGAALLACGTQTANDGADAEPGDSMGVRPEQSSAFYPFLPVVKPLFPTSPRGRTANGLEVPPNVLDWRVIGIADRPDDGTIQVIVGNEVAVRAARYGFTHPWPEGSRIARLTWDRSEEANTADAITPGAFAELALMVKDTAAFSSDDSWGYGVWRGTDLNPSTDSGFDRLCVTCHASGARENDSVFTRPARMPFDAALTAAEPMPNGLTIPQDFRDWPVVGLSRPSDGTIRVTAGNEVAVSAARGGQTSPWPDGSMLAQFVWSSVDDPDVPGAATSGDFASFALMSRPGGAYTRDGGWQYGSWSGPQLAAPTDPGFDRACANCHTGLASTRDFVFTQPGEVPELAAPLEP